MKLFIVTLILITTSAYADTSSDIEKAILLNLQHTQNEDIDATMSDLHSQSPAYFQTQQVLHQLFPVYDLKYELLSYNFVARDDEYAYARIKQRTSKANGPEFQNNELDMLVILKQENEVWKLWTQVNLSITYL